MIKKIYKYIKKKAQWFFLGSIAFGATLPIIPQDMEFKSASEHIYFAPYSITSATGTQIISDTFPFPDTDGDGRGYMAIFTDSNGNNVPVSITKERYKRIGKTGGFDFNPTKDEYITIFEALK